MLDAIIVGAGLSGLVCARRLVDAGARVVVLEARDRVGGRLYTGRIADAAVDLGGQWVTAGQPRVIELAGALGVRLAPHERAGRTILDERAGRFAQLVAAVAQWRAMRRIEHLMRADRDDLDRTSLDDYLAHAIGNATARARIRLHAELVFAADPAALSLLHYLRTMRATDGFSPRGTSEARFVGGAQQLALALGDQLGDRVHVNEPVAHVAQDASGVTVDGYRARRAVLAVPPPLVRRMTIELPPAARAYVDAAFGGPVVKCFAAYERAAWRDRGLSGESYRPSGAVRATVELVDARGGPAVLLAFIVGREAARWSSRDPGERRAEVLAAFAPLTDEPPLDYLERDWGSDPWAAGCVPGLPPGALASGARWREPIGRVHVAGTETAVAWPGYMEGAIEAGERAAAEVLAAL